MTRAGERSLQFSTNDLTPKLVSAPRAVRKGRLRHMSAGHRCLLLHIRAGPHILNHMDQYLDGCLDISFAALSDPTRREVLELLCRTDASITDLANRFQLTLTGMKKHVAVLERAGLVATEKIGRVRTCRLGLRALEEEAAWLARHHELWRARFDELDKIVGEMKTRGEDP